MDLSLGEASFAGTKLPTLLIDSSLESDRKHGKAKRRVPNSATGCIKQRNIMKIF